MSYDQLRDEARASTDATVAVRLFCRCKRQPASVVATPAGYLYRGEMLFPDSEVRSTMVAEAKAGQGHPVDPMTCTVSFLILDDQGARQTDANPDQMVGYCHCRNAAKQGRAFSVSLKELEQASIRHRYTGKAQKISV